MTLEAIMATRISLLGAVRHREQRRQVGTLTTPFLTRLLDVEKECFLRISEAARESQHMQIALNSVIRARSLDRDSNPQLSLEYANVLWLQKEHKLAVQYLKDLNQRYFRLTTQDDPHTRVQKAVLLARLVRLPRRNLRV